MDWCSGSPIRLSDFDRKRIHSLGIEKRQFRPVEFDLLSDYFIRRLFLYANRLLIHCIKCLLCVFCVLVSFGEVFIVEIQGQTNGFLMANRTELCHVWNFPFERNYILFGFK